MDVFFLLFVSSSRVLPMYRGATRRSKHLLRLHSKVSWLYHLFYRGKAAYYNRQKYLPGNVLIWSFDIVLRSSWGGLTPGNVLLYSSRRFQNIFPFLRGRSSYVEQTRIFVQKKPRAVKYRVMWRISLYLTALYFSWTKTLVRPK